jgi:transposase-like protein
MYPPMFVSQVLNWHQENGSIIKKTARTFHVAPKTVRRWVRERTVIGVGSGRTAFYQEVERDRHVRRKSYTREFKLRALKWHEENGSVVSKTSREFDIPYNSMSSWIRKKTVIADAKRGARHVGGGRVAFYPDMERLLYDEFLEHRREGHKIRQLWFKER